MVGGVPEEVSCFDYVAVSGEEAVAWVDVLGFLPRLIRDVPELVILSRGDRAIANLELDEGVFMRPDCGYRTSAGFTALWVMGPNEIADSEFGNPKRGSVSEEHLGISAERTQYARGCRTVIALVENYRRLAHR